MDDDVQKQKREIAIKDRKDQASIVGLLEGTVKSHGDLTAPTRERWEVQDELGRKE